MKLIDKSALVAEIERMKNYYENIQMIKPVYESNIEDFNELLSFIENLEVKEVDLDLITGWFDHIAQIADDRMTLTNQRMTDAHALDEIKCLAKNSSEFITKHYKAQKGEEV